MQNKNMTSGNIEFEQDRAIVKKEARWSWETRPTDSELNHIRNETDSVARSPFNEEETDINTIDLAVVV
jgi:hypothetical protein